jgi:hypothetical protein
MIAAFALTFGRENPIAIDRRQFLYRAAVLLGGAVSTGCANAVLGRSPDEPLTTTSPLLGSDERATLDAAVDRILPATATPGALEAGVPDFVEFVLAEGMGDAGRQRFRDGLARLDADARGAHGAAFAALPPEARDGLLTAVEQREMQERAAAAPGAAPELFSGLRDDKPFFATLKELTVVGFFTSEIGATQVFDLNVWPGRFDGCAAREPGVRPAYPAL